MNMSVHPWNAATYCSHVHGACASRRHDEQKRCPHMQVRSHRPPAWRSTTVHPFGLGQITSVLSTSTYDRNRNLHDNTTMHSPH